VADLKQTLELLVASISQFVPELILSVGVILLLLLSLWKSAARKASTLLAFLLLLLPMVTLMRNWDLLSTPTMIFSGMLRNDDFSGYLRLLFDAAGILTVALSWRRQREQQFLAEYYALILAIVLGAHLLVMSMNLVMVFLSLEMISINSYILTGFAFTRKSAEGSFKYFLFGAVGSATMLYGFSLLYGMTGTLTFASAPFVERLLEHQNILFLVGGMMSLAGLFYKIAAVPLHPWAPDIYEAAPMPVVAFFSVVPKLAGIGILTRFVLALNAFGQSQYDWQLIICIVAIASLTVGNFAALWQTRPRRLMAYSGIAQSGFLLVGIAAFQLQGVHFMLFYATVYMLMNFLVFALLQHFESTGLQTLESFSGIGRSRPFTSIMLLIGLIALTGIPPTAGFTAKLFVFTSVWESYHSMGKSILLWLLVFGLLNTVVSLFYYLRIPYYAFVKSGKSVPNSNNLTFENLFSLALVVSILVLFFSPGLLMGWINKINFVL
jgi:NADH-quinone oxidoreductase subunit N